MEALNEALERKKNIQQVKYEPEKEEKTQKEKQAIEETRENVEQKIFSEELNNKFISLETAIKAEEEKLKELYGIEKELSNLVVVVNAGKDYVAKLNSEKEEKEKEINTNIELLEEEYQAKKEELQKEYDLKAKNLKMEREREAEEYNYKTKREREISNNNWEDEKLKREKILSEKEQKAEELLKEAEEKTEHIKELEEKVEKIPELLSEFNFVSVFKSGAVSIFCGVCSFSKRNQRYPYGFKYTVIFLLTRETLTSLDFSWIKS